MEYHCAYDPCECAISWWQERKDNDGGEQEKGSQDADEDVERESNRQHCACAGKGNWTMGDDEVLICVVREALVQRRLTEGGFGGQDGLTATWEKRSHKVDHTTWPLCMALSMPLFPSTWKPPLSRFLEEEALSSKGS